MNKRIRQYLGILSAVFVYYIIHEGAHLLTALFFGTFKALRFLGLGVQIDVYAEEMTDLQMGLFCLAGPVATLLAGWLLIALTKGICRTTSNLLKTIMWYTTLTLLLLDSTYLSILCGFFGGGDMNGIRLLMPEFSVRLVFAGIGILHWLIIRNHLLPAYTEAFRTP